MAMEKPVDWDQLYPGKFLKAGEFLGRKVTLTIKEINLEELEGTKGKQIKGIVSFEETPKALPLNKTNGICLKAMFGKKLPDWVGKKIILFPTKHDGDDAIRVWGSPELKDQIAVEVALPRKKPFSMIMHTSAKEAA